MECIHLRSYTSIPQASSAALPCVGVQSKRRCGDQDDHRHGARSRLPRLPAPPLWRWRASACQPLPAAAAFCYGSSLAPFSCILCSRGVPVPSFLHVGRGSRCERADGRTGWTEGRMDVWADVQTEGQTKGRTDGQRVRSTERAASAAPNMQACVLPPTRHALAVQ